MHPCSRLDAREVTTPLSRLGRELFPATKIAAEGPRNHRTDGPDSICLNSVTPTDCRFDSFQQISGCGLTKVSLQGIPIARRCNAHAGQERWPVLGFSAIQFPKPQSGGRIKPGAVSAPGMQVEIRQEAPAGRLRCHDALGSASNACFISIAPLGLAKIL